MDAILNINKEADWTSFDVVAKVRRIVNEKRVGHAGTLDPFATGVLPVFIGKATSLIQYCDLEPKEYRATLCLGATTDTYDSTGNVLARKDASGVTTAQLEELLARFTGHISQTPPAYSALKIHGTPAYKLARKGQAPVMQAREVEIHSISMKEWHQDRIVLDITCGGGTYIRSLAHDIGQGLGCGAHLTALDRLTVGPFRVEDARTIGEITQSLAGGGTRPETLLRADFALRLPKLEVSPEEMRELRFGRIIRLGFKSSDGQLYSSYLADGSFVGVLKVMPYGGLGVGILMGSVS